LSYSNPYARDDYALSRAPRCRLSIPTIALGLPGCGYPPCRIGPLPLALWLA